MQEEKLNLEQLERMAHQLRVDVAKMIAVSGQGHAGGSMSVIELLTVLYFHEMRLDRHNPEWEERDRLVLSKGHASPALYSSLAEIGYIPKQLLDTLHQIDSPLQMHPELGVCPGVEMSSGALGQGLSAGVGMALGSRITGKDFRVFVIIGDGESAEGQIWEAAMCASKYALDNLVAILDYNKLTLTDTVNAVMPLEPVCDKWTSFGWHVMEVNGHSITQLVNALEQIKQVKGRPSMIIAHTVKGRGLPLYEDKVESHAINMSADQARETLCSLGCSAAEIEETLAKAHG